MDRSREEPDRILVIKSEGIAEIRLNEPRVLNAMGPEWPKDMSRAITQVRDDPEVRVVLVTGEGRSFSSGMNLTRLGNEEIPVGWFHENEHVFRSLETLEKPVICGIQGYCLGGGLQIAIACDVRIATQDAVLGLPAVKEAFIPGMSTFRLPRLIGLGNARHLILSGQNIDAREAHRIGLVNKLVPPDELRDELEAWAQLYLDAPAPSVAWSKRLSNLAYDLPFEAFLQEFDRAAEAVVATDEHQAARRAWLERKSRG